MIENPHAPEAEEALLAACMMWPASAAEACELLTPEDFYKPVHQEMFWNIHGMVTDGEVPEFSALATRMRGEGRAVPTEVMANLMSLSMTISPSQVTKYAMAVADSARLRRIILMAAEATAMARAGGDAAETIDKIQAMFADPVLTSKGARPKDLYSAPEFMALPEDNKQWVVPSLMRQGWRTLFVGTEGSGKSVLLRQFCVAIASGVHPFTPSREIAPVNTLFVDLENPEEVVKSQLRMSVRDQRLSLNENVWIWHREAGIDLLKRRDQAEFENVLREVKPRFVGIGPVYKSYDQGQRSWEEATISYQKFIDSCRVRFGFTVAFEHHAPKGAQGARDLVPFGSSAWLRWPEFGIKLVGKDIDQFGRPRCLEVGRFRGDRVANIEWPMELRRGGLNQMAWLGFWSSP